MMWGQIDKFWNFGPGRTALAAVCAHSVSISIGICQGYSAILIPQLKASYDFTISSEESSWLASLGAITNPLGSILSGLIAEYFGRKISIQFSSIPFIVGWLTIAFADDVPLLYLGRLITGVAAGMSSASYTYVSEISTPQHRGIFQALGPIAASFGILLTYTLGYLIKWSTIALISVTFAAFTLITVHFLPESPAYLIKQRRPTDSFASYLWLRRNNAAAQAELDQHQQTNNTTTSSTKTTKDAYLSPTTVKPFLILVTLFFLQELSGIYTILFYAVDFFAETDLDLHLDNYLASIIVGAIRFAMSIVAACLINRVGRKVLCVTSSAGMSVTMLIMCAYFAYYEHTTTATRSFQLLPLLCVVFNVFFSMLGMLPVPWILVGELFPLEVRSIMSGIVICLAQCFIFICVKIYPDMIDGLTFSGTLGTFLVASVLACVFSQFCLIETRNKSLHQIELEFSQSGGGLSGIDNKGFDLKAAEGNVANNNSTIQIISI